MLSITIFLILARLTLIGLDALAEQTKPVKLSHLHRQKTLDLCERSNKPWDHQLNGELYKILSTVILCRKNNFKVNTQNKSLHHYPVDADGKDALDINPRRYVLEAKSIKYFLPLRPSPAQTDKRGCYRLIVV